MLTDTGVITAVMDIVSKIQIVCTSTTGRLPIFCSRAPIHSERPELLTPSPSANPPPISSTRPHGNFACIVDQLISAPCFFGGSDLSEILPYNLICVRIVKFKKNANGAKKLLRNTLGCCELHCFRSKLIKKSK
jgi:hypothetical protein